MIVGRRELMIMNNFELTALLLIVSIPALAAHDALDFKGFPLGGRVEAFKQKFPSFQCKPTKDHQIACDSSRETYAGVDVDSILVSFSEARLHGFQIDGAGAEKRAQIVAAMNEKYGAPRSEEGQLTQWELSNGNCRLLWGPPPKFQMICASNASLPKSDKPAKDDI
jgi:hypothetical protein